MITGILDAPCNFGDYAVVTKQGSDSVSTMYRGYAMSAHPLAGRILAIRILHDHLADQPDGVAKFQAECTAAVAYGPERPCEFGQVDGRHFFVIAVCGQELNEIPLLHLDQIKRPQANDPIQDLAELNDWLDFVNESKRSLRPKRLQRNFEVRT